MCEFAAEEELKEKERQESCYACDEFCGSEYCPFYKENDGN